MIYALHITHDKLFMSINYQLVNAAINYFFSTSCQLVDGATNYFSHFLRTIHIYAMLNHDMLFNSCNIVINYFYVMCLCMTS